MDASEWGISSRLLGFRHGRKAGIAEDRHRKQISSSLNKPLSFSSWQADLRYKGSTGQQDVSDQTSWYCLLAYPMLNHVLSANLLGRWLVLSVLNALPEATLCALLPANIFSTVIASTTGSRTQIMSTKSVHFAE